MPPSEAGATGPSLRVGDFAAALRMMQRPGVRSPDLARRRQMVADIVRLMGAQVTKHPNGHAAPTPGEVRHAARPPARCDVPPARAAVGLPPPAPIPNPGDAHPGERRVSGHVPVNGRSHDHGHAAPHGGAGAPADAQPPAALSPRMRQTLQRLLAGDAEKQIARRLSLSPHTVHVYVKALYRHFGVCSRGELLARFVRQADGE